MTLLQPEHLERRRARTARSRAPPLTQERGPTARVPSNAGGAARTPSSPTNPLGSRGTGRRATVSSRWPGYGSARVDRVLGQARRGGRGRGDRRPAIAPSSEVRSSRCTWSSETFGPLRRRASMRSAPPEVDVSRYEPSSSAHSSPSSTTYPPSSSASNVARTAWREVVDPSREDGAGEPGARPVRRSGTGRASRRPSCRRVRAPRGTPRPGRRTRAGASTRSTTRASRPPRRGRRCRPVRCSITSWTGAASACRATGRRGGRAVVRAPERRSAASA